MTAHISTEHLNSYIAPNTKLRNMNFRTLVFSAGFVLMGAGLFAQSVTPQEATKLEKESATNLTERINSMVQLAPEQEADVYTLALSYIMAMDLQRLGEDREAKSQELTNTFDENILVVLVGEQKEVYRAHMAGQKVPQLSK